MVLETIALPIIALVLSGITWTGFGYFSNWRKNHNNPDWAGFDVRSLRNDVILGLILGVGSIIYSLINTGELATVADAQGFFTAIIAGFPAIAAVDKFIVGGILGK